MGFFGRLIGRYAPQPGVEPISAEQLKANLLALNRPSAPFIVRECTADDPENADLVAEWRTRQPAWHAIFGSANLSHSFQVFMRLLPDRHQVQSIDQTWDVNWSGGIPSFSLSKTGTRGLQWEYKAGIKPFYETTPGGERIAYHFSSSELKMPLHATVTQAGWSWRSRFAGWLPSGSHAEAVRANHPPGAGTRWLVTGVSGLLAFGLTQAVLTPVWMTAEIKSVALGRSTLFRLLPLVLALIVALVVGRIAYVRMNR